MRCCGAAKTSASAYSGRFFLKKAPMSSSFSSRFFNPLMLWTDVALKTQEMLVSSGSVIQIRTERMAKAGLAPSAADLAEFQLMSHEKLAAASESSTAIVNQLHTASYSLMNRSVRIWITEPDDRSISWVLSATSVHSMKGLKKRELNEEGMSAFFRERRSL